MGQTLSSSHVLRVAKQDAPEEDLGFVMPLHLLRWEVLEAQRRIERCTDCIKIGLFGVCLQDK